MADNNNQMGKFDPEPHRENVYDAFNEFVNAFAYEYEAIAKDPPSDTVNKESWVELNKRKIFLGRFASRNLQVDYEDAVPTEERSTITFTTMVQRLQARYKPTRNLTLANYEFHKLKQHENEGFDMYVNRVKHEANNCNFVCSNENCTVPSIMIRDQIIIGTSSNDIQKNALKNQWELKELIENGRQLEAAALGAKRIIDDKTEDSPMYRIHKPGRYSNKYQKDNRETIPRKQPDSQCQNCSSKTCQGKKKCLAYYLECFDCHKKGHFRGAPICKYVNKRNTRRVETESSNDSATESETESNSPDNLVRDSKTIPKSRRAKQHSSAKYVTKIRRMRRKKKVRRLSKRSRYQVEVVIKENLISAFADTGADINVMSQNQANNIGLPLTKTKMKIRPYGSKPLKCIGHYDGTIMYNSTVANIRIYVVNQPVETLLSGRTCEELGIIKFYDSKEHSEVVHRIDTTPEITKIVTNFADVFEGVGKLKDHTVRIYIDSNVPPVASPPRPIPFHLRERFNNEIEKMIEANIIEEHEGPAPWISNVVLAPKDDGGVRVTVDMRCANKAIMPTNIPIPRAEDIKTQLSNCKYFSKLDLRSAFHQLEIDEQSRYITVFHANGKLMRYRRLTMGAKPASGELTKALTPLFQNIPHAHIIHDDIIIGTDSLEKHHIAIEQVLKTISNSGLTLKREKCIFAQKQIPFWGLTISSNGIKPDPSKVDALKHADRPRNKDEVMSFLCMIQSQSDFIPNLSRKTFHLRNLTKKHTHFKWDKHLQKEFNDLKASYQKETMLRFYDPTKKTFIYVDAHISGLSAILVQGDTIDDAQPVAFTSRATTNVERRYPQLDLEALAIDFGLRRFRQYLVGGPITDIITDHRPLVSIFSNTRSGSIRTSRIKLRHQDISYNVIWRAGKNNPADYLSRHAIPITDIPKPWQKETHEFEKTIWFLQYSPYTESISMAKIIKETNNDPTLMQLKLQIAKGFIPKSQTSLNPFRRILQELTISDQGLILKSDKIVLPESLWKTAFTKAHQGGHPGMSSLKRRLRTHFWFPTLDSYIENKVKECHLCQMFTGKTMKEPITAVKTPKYPWQNVSIDLFGPMPNHKHILVVQDMLSRFPAARIVPSTSTTPVIEALNSIYTDYGNPESHRSDNGPPFNSKEFADFSKSHSIMHHKTFPYHPQANPVETFMKPIGKAMKIAHYNKTSLQDALNSTLAAYRSTPHPATCVTPAQMLFRSSYNQDFASQPLTNEQVDLAQKRDQEQRLKRQEELNTSTHRKESHYEPNSMVLVKNDIRCKFDPMFGPTPFKVIKSQGNGLILERSSDNRIFRRHCDDVKPIFKENVDELSLPESRPDTLWIWNQPNYDIPANNQESSFSSQQATPACNSQPTFDFNLPQSTNHSTATQQSNSQQPQVSNQLSNDSVDMSVKQQALTISDTVKQRQKRPPQRYTDLSHVQKKGK